LSVLGDWRWEELLAVVRDGEGVLLAAAADGLLAVIPCQVALEEWGARRKLARKMLLPVFPHL
jgi:hypothetical protein